MWKKALICIGLITFLIIGIEIYNYSKKQRKMEEDSTKVLNETEISEQYVTDNCIDEWEDYALKRQEEILNANQNLNDENRHYILKEKNSLINIYYINENNEEILYKVTEIGTQYLSREDTNKLKEGIEIIGLSNLNKVLEDFE